MTPLKKWLFSIGYKVSLIKVDFPLPETPVIAIIKPNGNSALIFFKLFPIQPFIINLSFDFLLTSGTGIVLILFKKFEVTVLLLNLFKIH